jgi:hypothetical protein
MITLEFIDSIREERRLLFMRRAYFTVNGADAATFSHVMSNSP